MSHRAVYMLACRIRPYIRTWVCWSVCNELDSDKSKRVFSYVLRHVSPGQGGRVDYHCVHAHTERGQRLSESS